MTPLLELDHVDVSYGAARALEDVSLEVRPGEIVSLLGGNASGKSTTMKSILGLVRPQSGTVSLDGVDITTTSTPHRIRAGMQRNIYPGLKATALQSGLGQSGQALGFALANPNNLPRCENKASSCKPDCSLNIAKRAASVRSEDVIKLCANVSVFTTASRNKYSKVLCPKFTALSKA